MHYLCPLWLSIKSYTLPEEERATTVLHYTSPGPPGCDAHSTMFSLFVVTLHLRKAAAVFASLGPAVHLQEFISLIHGCQEPHSFVLLISHLGSGSHLCVLVPLLPLPCDIW